MTQDVTIGVGASLITEDNYPAVVAKILDNGDGTFNVYYCVFTEHGVTLRMETAPGKMAETPADPTAPVDSTQSTTTQQPLTPIPTDDLAGIEGN